MTMQKKVWYRVRRSGELNKLKDMNTNNFVTLLSNYRNLDLLITLLMRRAKQTAELE